MTSLQNWYDTRARALDSRDFLSQACHTQGGKAVSGDVIGLVLGELRAGLEFAATDRVLDLCCGNGLFTHALAGEVADITGVDFSGELIRLAQTHNTAPNLRYMQGDATRLDQIETLADRRYDKIYMNASLQHFKPDHFPALLDSLLALASDDPVLMFTFIPEDGKQRLLFDTLKKRLIRLRRRLTGRDYFGDWWRPDTIRQAAAARGFACDILPVNPDISYGAYRFHARLTKLRDAA